MKTQILLIISIFFFSYNLSLSQISNTYHIHNQKTKVITKVEEFIDTVNFDNWKITTLSYSNEGDTLIKKEIGFIKPKPKEIFYIYKKEISYFESGQKSHEYILTNNLKDSIETYWYKNGQKYSLIRWKEGRKNGRSILWHENGDVKNIKYYKNDSPDGESIWFHPKKNRNKFGDFFSISHYEDGDLKFSKSYRHDGLLQEETEYNDTARITNFYYKSGKLKRKDITKNPEYIYEEKNCKEVYYREDGTLKMIVITKNGKITVNDYDEEGNYIDWLNEEVRKKRMLKND